MGNDSTSFTQTKSEKDIRMGLEKVTSDIYSDDIVFWNGRLMPSIDDN